MSSGDHTPEGPDTTPARCGDPHGRRLQREIAHHRHLAEGDPESAWGWGSPAGRARADRRAQHFLASGRVGPGARVLELGCGTGEFTLRVTGAGVHVVALDLVAELLARAQRKIGPGRPAFFVRGDAQVLPFPDRAFNVVYGCSVLHHLDLDRALHEVRRVLAPGGRLVFSEPNLLNPQVFLMFKCRALKRHFSVSADESAFTRGTIIRLLRRTGFERVAVRYFDFLHPAVPAGLVPSIERIGSCVEQIPVLSALSGSLFIYAERPYEPGRSR